MSRRKNTGIGPDGKTPGSVVKRKDGVDGVKESLAPLFWPSFPEQVKMIALSGLTDNEMADMVGVSRYVFRKWKETYPGFARALEEGRSEADARVVMALYQRAIGYSHPEEKIKITEDGDVYRAETVKHYPPEVRAIEMWLTNRQKEKWKRHHEHSLGGSDTDIPIGIRDESKEELISSILNLVTAKEDPVI